MKINHKFSVGAIALAFIFVGCKKSFTERDPFTDVSPQIAVGSESNLKDALNGAYANLRSVNMFGGAINFVGDIQADNVYINRSNSNRYQSTFKYDFNINSTEAESIGTQDMRLF